MLVADAGALVSLGTVDVLDTVLVEYDVYATETVVEELAETAAHDDVHADGASAALDGREQLTIEASEGPLAFSRIDAGEGSCAVPANRLGADFLPTDDLRALPELEAATEAQVAISPIVLRALVDRGVLDRPSAVAHLETLAGRRGWLGSPIYRRAQSPFEDERGRDA